MTKLLPLNIVSIDDGVPLRHCLFEFKTKKSIRSIETTFQNENYENLFVLASTTQTKENLQKSSDMDIISPYLPEVSLVCSIYKTSSIEDEISYVIKPLEYVRISKIIEKRKENYCEIQVVEMSNKYPINGDIAEVKDLVAFLYGSSSYYTPEIEELIYTSDTVDQICNVIAITIFRENFELYIYQQTTDQKQKFKDCIEALMQNAPVFSLSMKDIAILSKQKDEESNSSTVSDKKIFELFLEEFTKQTAQNESQSSSQKSSKLDLPENVKTRYKKERARLKRLPQASLEFQTQLDYIELLEDIPWKVYSNIDLNLKEIKKELNKSHQGLEEVKEDILNHFALEKHLEAPYGTVMCFLGPPGTGKTSIVNSIAKVTNRKIIKIALGGMNDEAEFRGHRRTYVASKPGRIISAIKECGVMDPIVLLDEIDKISKDFRSNPTAALLEILDPEQNHSFIDRYLELPIDLSKCLFIATANYKEKIPAPLLDRLDIINFKDYNEEEKLSIFENYTYPKKIKELKMENLDIEIKEDFKNEIKKFGNREAEKILVSILKKIIYEKLYNNKTSHSITAEMIKRTKKTQKIGFS
jgi:ATP-dependent Lon protease